jgi:protein-S-isoprenylcysteine O-methyltransferase Ste14
MQAETFTAAMLLTCLACFFAVNLHNILRVHKRRGDAKVYAEIERPSGVAVTVAGICTLVYFLEALSYLLLSFADLSLLRNSLAFGYQSSYTVILHAVGTVLTILGYCLFLWSVIARGRYATSWGMPENHRLVTWGPYKYVRNPSYSGYFLMFIGLFVLWSGLFTLVPLAAIPGYFRVARKEEELLTRRFGTEYLEYMRKTGRFLPKLRSQP